MPLSVAGVTTAPSEMPISTSSTRTSGVGISIGRPASEAAATARIEPDKKPAGMPRRPSVTPPAAAITSVSASWRTMALRSMAGGSRDTNGDFRGAGMRELRRGPSGAINAARRRFRQMALKTADRG